MIKACSYLRDGYLLIVNSAFCGLHVVGQDREFSHRTCRDIGDGSSGGSPAWVICLFFMLVKPVLALFKRVEFVILLG